MSVTTVKVRRNKSDKSPTTVTYAFGDDVYHSVKMFDGDSPLDKVVHGLFVIAAKQQLQDFVRSLIAPRKAKPAKKGKKGAQAVDQAPGNVVALTPEEIQAKVNAWKPTVERVAKRTVEKAKKVIDGLSAEERAVLLNSLLDSQGDGTHVIKTAQKQPLKMGIVAEQ